MLKVQVKTSALGRLIGRGGENIKRLQAQYNCQIIIPKRENIPANSESVIVTVKSSGEEDQLRSLELILKSLNSSSNSLGERAKLTPTHFISIPLNEKEIIADEIERFKSLLISKFGVPQSSFISTEKMHLTLLVLRVNDQEELDNAIEVFEEKVRPVVLDSFSAKDLPPFSLALDGLDIMKGTAEAARVIYLKVNESKRDFLSNLSIAMRNILTDHGINVIADEDSSLKLHATLINVKYSGNAAVSNVFARDFINLPDFKVDMPIIPASLCLSRMKLDFQPKRKSTTTRTNCLPIKGYYINESIIKLPYY